jgi:heptosyltransferase-1
MGDVLHTLPALTDAAQAFPGIRFDWVVEEGFAQIPSWHEERRPGDPGGDSPLA